MPTPLTVTQTYDAPPAAVYALFADRDFVEARLTDVGGLDTEVVSVDTAGDQLTIVTRQTIPASVLPSMVAAMIPGDPATERTEVWSPDGDGYAATFSLVVKGAPATLKGTMRLSPAATGSTLEVEGQATVPIPLLGGKIEGVITEQVGELLRHEETFTRTRLSG